jgi:hypothetical protein
MKLSQTQTEVLSNYYDSTHKGSIQKYYQINLHVAYSTWVKNIGSSSLSNVCIWQEKEINSVFFNINIKICDFGETENVC